MNHVTPLGKQPPPSVCPCCKEPTYSWASLHDGNAGGFLAQYCCILCGVMWLGAWAWGTEIDDPDPTNGRNWRTQDPEDLAAARRRLRAQLDAMCGDPMSPMRALRHLITPYTDALTEEPNEDA